MVKGIQWIIERIAERFIPLIGGMFSSTVETFHALGLAEQQSQLEEAARRYEVEGKTEIAAALRQRAAQLASDNPAEQAVRIAENVASQPLLPSTNGNSDGSQPGRLPDLKQSKPKARRKKSSSVKDTPSQPAFPSIDSGTSTEG